MTPDDPIVRTFLERSLVARIATRSANGWPALAPLWCVEDGERLYAATGAATLAARNALRRSFWRCATSRVPAMAASQPWRRPPT